MKIRKKICSLLLVCLAFLGIFCGRANVYADQKQALSATVTLLKQEKDCVVQVETKNSGADFSGKVRLVFSGTDNSSGCAFEQCLTLPQNGKKQYTMTIPYADVSQTRGNGIVAFVDEKGTLWQVKHLPVFLAKKSAVLVWECFRIIMMRLAG